MALRPSSWLIGLGLLLGLATAASGLAEARRSVSPFDQVDEPARSSLGFDPALVPVAELAAPPAAPTLAPTPVLTSASPATSPSLWQDPAAGEGPPPTATPAPVWIPDWLVIPAIELDAPVVPAALKVIATWGQEYQQWVAPDTRAAGWHTTSAPLSAAGNTVLNGHHNIRGEVFGHLAELQAGDLIWVYAGSRAFVYRIVLVTILPERWQPIDVRLANAQWMQPSQDERLTLVTCWPQASNTHRLVIVATPISLAAIEDYALTPRLTPPASTP